MLAGLGAVGGAIFIGLRQMAITRRQADIQGQQALIAQRALDLESLKVRATLFDERFKVYQTTREWIQFVFMHDRMPAGPYKLGPREEGEADLALRFSEQLDRARFLFSPRVYQGLAGMVDEGWEMVKHTRRAQRAKDDDEISKHYDESHAAYQRFREVANKLNELFGDELSLSEKGGTHGDIPEIK